MTTVQRKPGAAPASSDAKRGGPLSFFTGLISEFKKVVWPPRRELVRLTLMVLAMTIALGIVLGLIDYGFTHLVTLIGGG